MGRSSYGNRTAGRGRGGGRGSGHFNKKKDNYAKNKKTLEDHYFYVGSSKQASDFEVTFEFLVNYIKRTYIRGNDIAEALRTMKLPNTNLWKPSLQVSLNFNDADEKRENRQFELDYKAEYDEYMKRKRSFEENCYKSYAEIWARCNKAMKSKIESRKDYESEVYNKPVKLLEAIKEHALNYEENRYEMSIILDAMKAFIDCKQKEKEVLQEYTKRFKVAREIFQSHIGGELILTKYVQSMPGYKEDDLDKIKELTEKADEQFCGFLYLVNSDQGKYGSVIKGLHSQKALQNDQYPRTVIEANNVLSTHRFDFIKEQGTKQSKDKERSKINEKYKEVENKNDDESPALSFAQLEGKCYCCGKPGHKSPDCYSKSKIPREEWAINKVQMVTTKTKESTTEETCKNKETDEVSEKFVGWAGVHFAFAQDKRPEFEKELKKLILLDSDSNATIFCERKYVKEVWDVDESMGVGTNGDGELISSQKCIIPHLGEHWFNQDSMMNIIAMKDMTDRYRVTMDSAVEKAMFVHMPDKIVIFKQLKNNLYGMNPEDPKSFLSKDEYEGKKLQFVNTVKDNTKYMSNRQMERAKAARKAMQALGTPTTNDFKAMIRMNLIKNVKITTKDVNMAEKAYGPDVGAKKGKTTRRKPQPAIDNQIEIPKELISLNEEVILSIDGMTVNTLKFLTTISHEIYYRTGQYVATATSDEFIKCMNEIYYVYKKGGFTVREIHCDNESHKAMDEFAASKNPVIVMNYANAQEHVPRAERNIRTIKERVRCNYYQIPYTHLPRTVVKYMCIEAAKKLNYFPAKRGISKYYSPRMIMHQQNLDFDKHCKYVLGEYVQSHEDESIKNDNKPRTLDCLYLRPTASNQGGHELLHLGTNRVITRNKVTQIPITPSVIRLVHAIAKKENMPRGLKIKNRTNTVLFETTWSTGVEYDERQFDEEENDSDYESGDEESYNQEEELKEDEYDHMDENELADILDQQYVIDNESEDEQNEDNIIHEQEQNNNYEEENEEEYIPNQDDEEEEKDNSGDNVTTNNAGVRRTTRQVNVPTRYGTLYQHLHSKMEKERCDEYSSDTAVILAHIMCQYDESNTRKMSKKKFYQFVQTYTLNKGIKRFGMEAKRSAFKEMKQLHDRIVFKPVRIENLTELEKKRAMESLMFLVEKRDKRLKSRIVANGSTQRSYVPKEEAASPTASTDSIIVTGVVDAKQKRDVMILDIPNAFVQTTIPQGEKDERIIMKIRGVLVDMLVEMSPEIYEEYVVYEKGKKVLYVQLLKALYGMMKASVLYYKKFRKDIEEIGYEVNPYDICIANKMVNGHQHTITWHVDDVKSSHVDPQVNEDFYKWCEQKYGEDGIGKVSVSRGKRHDYLAMILDYTEKNKLKLDMKYYIEDMIKEFPYELKSRTKTPWNDKLFKVNDKTKKLDDDRKSIFHTFVMKAMFLCKRARPDIEPGICFLSSRTSKPDESDWQKLIKILEFLKGTKNDVLTLEANEMNILYWFIDAAFAVHGDMKSHSGLMFTMGKGAILSSSKKQKTNSRSSTEAELNATDEMLSKIMRIKRFVAGQGFKVKLNIIFQDNTSTMKLQKNGKLSSGKRTRHFDIKLFYITDLINRDEVEVRYCPTDDMIADYMSKPVVGAKFEKFRDLIMNLSNKHPIGQQECVGV